MNQKILIHMINFLNINLLYKLINNFINKKFLLKS